jgi:hypothetical protein
MNMHRALLTAVVPALLGLSAAPAGAQDSVAVSAPSAIGAFATASSSLVPVAGVVTGTPESVTFSGQALVQSVLVQDPDFGRPSLLVTVDLSSVSGVGSSTKAKYVVAAREVVQRRLASSQRVVFTFPFSRSGTTTIPPRAGVMSMAFDVDLNTGAVSRVTANVGSPPL